MFWEELGNKKKLKSEHLQHISRVFPTIKNIILRNIKLTPNSLSGFLDLHLSRIIADNLSGITLEEIIDNLNEETLAHLDAFNVRKIHFGESDYQMAISKLGMFQNLQEIDLSCTELDSESLAKSIQFVPRLKHLDISETKVTSINSLLRVKDNLNSLIMHNLPLKTDLDYTECLNTILGLNELRRLDISNCSYFASNRLPEVESFIKMEFAPRIEHLDISSNPLLLTHEDLM